MVYYNPWQAEWGSRPDFTAWGSSMKKIGSLLSLFVLLVGLAACTDIPATTPATSQPAQTEPAGSTRTPRPTATLTPPVFQGSISIWHSWDEAQLPALLEIIAGFQETYPGILFDVLYVPAANLLPRYTQAASEGGGPALVLAPAEGGPDLFERDLVADLSGSVPDELLQRLSPPALGAAQYHAALIGVPYSQRGVVLYRNRRIIPERPETLADLIQLSQTFTEGEQIGAILERAPYYAGGHLFGFGGSFLDADGNPMFNTPAGLAWVELLQTFAQAGPPDYFTDNDLDLFSQARVGFVIGGTWNRFALAEAIGEDFLEIDPWPVHDQGALMGFVQTDNLFLNTNTSDAGRGLAALFIAHMLSDSTQMRLGESGLIPVVQVSLEDKLANQALTALAGGVAYPIQPEFSAFLLPLDQALLSVFDSGVPADQALLTAEEAVRNALANLTPTP
ncbi:MAG TPA: extracellular solute-binding protein [Anaerolineales bacterium]|nr:extracellular solute-binding protein [Anaerolineales bacterium]